MKNQKGITLVALVITIIVLLILAGVSISLVVGNNGVLTRASSAVETNRRAEAEQDIKMAVASCYTEYMSDWASNSSVDKASYFKADKINGYLSDQQGVVSLSGTTYTYNYGTGATGGTSTETAGRNGITFTVDQTTGAVTFTN